MSIDWKARVRLSNYIHKEKLEEEGYGTGRHKKTHEVQMKGKDYGIPAGFP